jgi:hypothetical protein
MLNDFLEDTFFSMEKDKQKHALMGLFIFALLNAHMMFYWSFLITLIVFAIGKELIWDKLLGKGTPEKADGWVTIQYPVYICITGIFGLFLGYIG